MKLISTAFIYSLVFILSQLNASPVNNIDEDPFLRAWLFIGPFDDFEKAKIASDSLSKLSKDQISSFVNSEKEIEAHTITSSSNTGVHSIHQYFPNHNKYIIGFSTIYSKNRVNVYYNHYLNIY